MESCKITSEVEHYHNKLKKNIEKDDIDRICYCLYKLNQIEIGLVHLYDTKIGLTINKLIEKPGEIGETAYDLVYKWKKMLADEQNQTIEDMENKNITITVKRKKTTDESDDGPSCKRTKYSDENKNTKTCMNQNRRSRRLYSKSDDEEVDNTSGKSFDDVMSGMIPSVEDMKPIKKYKKIINLKEEESKKTNEDESRETKQEDESKKNPIKLTIKLNKISAQPPKNEQTLSALKIEKSNLSREDLKELTPNELLRVEYNNPLLMRKTNSIWKSHCKKNFSDKKKRSGEEWKQFYLRCLSEEATKKRNFS